MRIAKSGCPGVIALFLSLLAYADSAVTGGYFAVIVSDIEVSRDWYAEVLDLQPGSRTSEQGRYDIVNLSRPGLWVELLEISAAESRPESLIAGPFKIGVLVEDIEAFVDALPKRLGRPEIVHDAQNNLLMIQLRDPDDHIVQVMQLIDAAGSTP